MKAQHQKTMLSADFPLNVFFTDVTEFPAHWHEVVEVVYVLDGSLRVGVNSEIYTMGPKDILLITGGDVHYFVPEPKRVNRLILHFDRAFFESAFPAAKNKRFSRVILTDRENDDPNVDRTAGTNADLTAGTNADLTAGLSADRTAGTNAEWTAGPTANPNTDPNAGRSVHGLLEEQILAIIEENHTRNDAYRVAMQARLFDILVILARCVPMQVYSPQERNRHLNRLGRLENVFNYVEENYHSDISLEEISSVANFSEYYFTRFFKEATGMTFGKYMNNYRVEKAAQLLKDTDDTITEVVFKSGFGSIKTFNRVFKQTKGCSPSAYKKTIFGV